MSLPVRIARAGAADLDVAAHILAAAFESYAWTRWSIPADDYAVRLERLQRLYLGHALEYGIESPWIRWRLELLDSGQGLVGP